VDVGDSPGGTRDKAEGVDERAGGIYIVHKPIATLMRHVQISSKGGLTIIEDYSPGSIRFTEIERVHINFLEIDRIAIQSLPNSR
jgi:hypothetical protein